jgi:hypothetical protein
MLQEGGKKGSEEKKNREAARRFGRIARMAKGRTDLVIAEALLGRNRVRRNTHHPNATANDLSIQTCVDICPAVLRMQKHSSREPISADLFKSSVHKTKAAFKIYAHTKGSSLSS